MHQSASTPKARPSRASQRIRIGGRIQVACINCKERKLKCDDQVPACANCQRSTLVCLVEDPATKRHQPRNYLETLEERVALLESMLQQVWPNIASDHFSRQDVDLVHDQDSLPAASQPFNDDSSTQHTIPQPPADEHDALNDLASKVGMLSLNAAGAEPLYLGSSSVFAFSHLIKPNLRQVVLQRPRNTLDAQPSNPFFLAPCLLPNYEIGVKLSNAYFQNIHTQYPFLHEPTFRAWEMALLQSYDAPESLTLEPTALFFLNMVYAVGALLVPNIGCSAERLYMSAQLYVDHVLLPGNLESIQAILCCAVYSLRSSIGTSHWKLAGLALRQCVDLGYHRSSKRLNLSLDPLRLELRKRTFWCAYVMECAGAVMLGRPLGLQYQDVDAELPLDLDDSCITEAGIYGTPRNTSTDPPTNMTGAIYAIRIRSFWGRIHSSLYSDTTRSSPVTPDYIARINTLRTELEAWRVSAPPVNIPPTSEAYSLFMTPDWSDITYSYTLLLLYRVQITDSEAQQAVSPTIFVECLRAAEAMCHAFRRGCLGKAVAYTWGLLHELFLAGLTYLYCLWTSAAAREATRQDQVSSTCTDCTIVLVLIAERWQDAAPYRDMFEALAQRTMTMMAKKNDENKQAREINAPAQFTYDEGHFGTVPQWMAGIADAGVPDGIDRLLSGLIGEWPPYEQHFADCENDSTWNHAHAGFFASE